MLSPLGYVLLACASALLAAGSFWFGRRSARPAPPAGGNLQQRYLAGFTQLLKEQPDAATEAFVTALDVNANTVDTHIAFGEMLRRRGEVEKAIRVHQNAMSQPQLARPDSERVQLALALDYKQAGLLDRAEVLLRELDGASDRSVATASVEALLDVLQLEREWPAAIAVAANLAGRKRGDDVTRLKLLQTHFACEQAELAQQQGSMQNYLHWTHEALRFTPKHPRPILNLARWDLAQSNPRAAVQRLKTVAEFPSLLPEVIPLLEAAYQADGRGREYVDVVEGLAEKYASGALLLKWARLASAGDDPQRVVEQLRSRAAHTADFGSLIMLLECLSPATDPHQLIEALQPLLRPAFECEHCGFASHQFYWRCPTCCAWL